YVEASPHDSELVSLEAAEIVIPEVKEIKDDNLREKLLNISSGSTTTDYDISLPDYEFFYFDDDHIEEISSGSTTTHSDISLSEYDSFIFDLANDQFPPIDRSDFTDEEFADELAHIISPSKYDCFCFRNLPDPGELISVLNSRIRENLSTTHVNLPVEDDNSPLLAYVVWIFLAYLTYPVIPPYLHSFGNEDTIFDSGITITHFCSFKPGLSHRCGAFKKFNTHRSHLNEWPMIINGKNTPILDVLLTNIVNAPREPIIVKQDHGVNPPPIDECCCECGDALNGIFCQHCTSRYWKIPACCDDDDDYNSTITPVLSIEEPDNPLSMGDEHLDTIPATKSDEVIKSSVEDLVPIPSESKGIPDTMCDVHFVNNPTPLEAKDHFEIALNSNDDISSSDDDSLCKENIEYVEASPYDSELVSLEAAEIVIPEVEEIKDDNLREKLLNVRLLIANIEGLKDNLAPSSEFLTKSSSTSPKSFLEETNTFHNFLPEFENFCFDLEEISSDSTTTHSNISFPDYEVFYFNDDHIEEISSGSTTTHSDISLSEYDSFIFDLSKDQFPPADRSDFTHEEFADELAHIISPPEYDRFYFRNLLDPGELMSILNSEIRENV
nr:hypothetical protein [Tanacetum cinerariifolium]